MKKQNPDLLVLDLAPARHLPFRAQAPELLRARLYGLRRRADVTLWASGRRLEAVRRAQRWRRNVRAVSVVLSLQGRSQAGHTAPGRDTAYDGRNRVVVLAAILAMKLGLRAGRCRSPTSDDEDRYSWVVQIDLGQGRPVTWEIDITDTDCPWECLPEIGRTSDGYDVTDRYVRLAAFVHEMRGAP